MYIPDWFTVLPAIVTVEISSEDDSASRSPEIKEDEFISKNTHYSLPVLDDSFNNSSSRAQKKISRTETQMCVEEVHLSV